MRAEQNVCSVWLELALVSASVFVGCMCDACNASVICVLQEREVGVHM